MLSFSISLSSILGILKTIDEDLNHISLLQLSKKDAKVGDSIDIWRNMSTAQCVSVYNKMVIFIENIYSFRGVNNWVLDNILNTF